MIKILLWTTLSSILGVLFALSLIHIAKYGDDCIQYDTIPFYTYNVALKMMMYQPIMVCAKYKEAASKHD